MRRTKASGSFFLCLIINLFLNAEWALPALLLLGLHFWTGLSIWWFWSALALWLLVVLLSMLFMAWAAGCGKEALPYRENKNPYSAKTESFLTSGRLKGEKP